MAGRRSRVEVFLSHSTLDSRFVKRLAAALERRRVHAWYVTAAVSCRCCFVDAI
jgi:hypothetical protein